MRLCLLLGLLGLLAGCSRGPAPDPRRSAPEEEPIKSVVDRNLHVERLGPPRAERAAAPDRAEMVELAKTDPVAFVSQVVDRYDREVTSYRVTLDKQERVGGKLLGLEVVRCSFREKPFSVLMEWQKGANRAQKTLYVEGENNNQLLALPTGRILSLIGPVSKDPRGSEAKSSSRYPVTEFGIQLGTRRVLSAMTAAKKRGDLKVIFNGEKKIPELNDRLVWELKRVGYPKPEVDGIEEETFYFDVENWLQIGSILKDGKGNLIATYYFRDLELEPDLPDDTFSRASLGRK